ncbi:MAG TPA: hypothetical protein VFT16_05390 [Candidatus Saccharimonadales bacterium]|nr:hypothetical protein [Candidatus Saccharimonadales bacterium]
MKGDQQHPAASQADANWQYQPNQQPAPAEHLQSYAAPVHIPEEVAWTASEFVSHNKGMGWYSLLAGGAAVLAAVIYFVTRDVISAGIIIFVAVLLGVSAVRKPRVLHYQVNAAGLAIGDKFYPYAEFKSFAVMQEGAFSSIMFLPLRRFMPSISIYYDPQDEDRIIEVLSYYLPMEMRTHDFVDSIIRRIRF